MYWLASIYVEHKQMMFPASIFVTLRTIQDIGIIFKHAKGWDDGCDIIRTDSTRTGASDINLHDMHHLRSVKKWPNLLKKRLRGCLRSCVKVCTSVRIHHPYPHVSVPFIYAKVFSIFFGPNYVVDHTNIHLIRQIQLKYSVEYYF